MTEREKAPAVAGALLPHHERFPYSGIKHRTAYKWPNGTRLAVYIGLNLEHFAFGEGHGAELAPHAHHPDVLNYSWREYGNRVGVWRLIDLFDGLDFPVSVLVNSSIYRHCPEVMDAFRARGDEVVGHGRTNSERQGVLDEPAERTLIEEATAVIEAFEGKPPAGWLGPWISESRCRIHPGSDSGAKKAWVIVQRLGSDSPLKRSR